MNNDEVVASIKDFEGRKLKEIKNMGPNNWAMIFEAEDGTMPSINFYTDTHFFTVRAKKNEDQAV